MEFRFLPLSLHTAPEAFDRTDLDLGATAVAQIYDTGARRIETTVFSHHVRDDAGRLCASESLDGCILRLQATLRRLQQAEPQ